ncbi:MAG: hypothetical protein IPP61_01580 [Cytophagaceae bacterium]|nr:hypothetical protein [Cytophagaceae bacterium]MBL0323863.1 hypothetical protein [Cytophagaceae bacterium]
MNSLNQQKDTNPKKKSKMSQWCDKIIGTNDGDFRGVTIGQDFEAIRKIEKMKLLDEGEDFMTFSCTNDDFELIDISYFGKNQKLDSIKVNVYLNHQADSELLLNEMKTQFTEKFGIPVIEGDGLYWHHDRLHTVSLKNRSHTLDNGIVITIEC